LLKKAIEMFKLFLLIYSTVYSILVQ
jgi:hypothetical protein